MQVFVTGATGWVGSIVVKDLIANGHKVIGLARTEIGAQALAATGAGVLRGTLSDLDCLRSGTERSDGVIHTAFNHDFSKIVENSAEERRAIEAIGDVLKGSSRPFIGTSGVLLLAPGRVTTEADPPRPVNPSFPRASEEVTAQIAERGVRATVVRLPPSVHGLGDHGFVPTIIGFARQRGFSAYVGDGNNRWPATHRLDAARVYRLALERGAEGGPFHAVAEEGVPFKEIAEVIGRRLNIPVVSKSRDEAAELFGLFGMFMGANAPSSSERTRSSLGWKPEQPGLLADIDQPGYFGEKQ